MKRFKVFLPSGVAVTIQAERWYSPPDGEIAGNLYMYDGDAGTVGFFPRGGWHGIQNVSPPTVTKEN